MICLLTILTRLLLMLLSLKRMTVLRTFNARTTAQLLKMEFDDLFTRWEASRPLRVGMPHASAVLSDESEWCVRRHVLGELWPELAEKPEVKPWNVKNNRINKHGWVLHEKYQDLILKFGNVAYVNGHPELDYTHYDEERMVHFSPDAIINFAGQQYIVEIKGYKNTDDENYPYEAFEKFDEAGQIPLKAHRQCNFYCHLMGIERGCVLVEGKNTQDTKVWTFEHDAEMARPYTQRCYDFKGALRIATETLASDGKAKLPVRKCRACTDGLAQRCPMRKVCFER
jgi:hypothetical protein